MNVILCGTFEPFEAQRWQDALQAALPEAQWLSLDEARKAPDGVRNAVLAAVVANPAPGSLASVGALPALRGVQSLWAGVERLLLDPSLPPHWPIARMVDPGLSAAMVETALWAVLSLHRGFFAYAQRQAQAQWQTHAQQRAQDVDVLVLGQGVLGSAVTNRLLAQGYAVHGWRRSEMAAHQTSSSTALRPDAGDGGSGGTTPQDGAVAAQRAVLQALLARLTALRPGAIVVNLLPLTPQTRGLINAEFLAALPPDASLVNLARGAHVVEADLLAALDQRRLRHAVLDVFQTEPLPSAHPFWRHPAVTVLPHAAALTDPRSAAQVVALNLRRLQRGEPMLHLVDRQRGY